MRLRESEQNLRHLAAQLLTAQERERQRISWELHDELGQALLVLKLQARALGRLLGQDQAAQKECLEMSANLDQLVENVRRLSRDLSPSALEDLGMSVALRRLLEEFARRHQIQFNLDLPPDLDKLFSREAQLNIYRIFQESLTNIGKYAQASKLTVDARHEDGRIFFLLADNGQGFDVEQMLAREPTHRGLGLAAMKERVRMLDGILEITSQKGQGTKVSFSIPVPPES